MNDSSVQNEAPSAPSRENDRLDRPRDLRDVREKILVQLEALVKHVPGVLYQFVARPDGSAYYAYVSDNLRDVYGCDPQLACLDAKILMARIHSQDIDRIKAAIDASATQMTPFHEKFRINHPDKGVRWVEARSTPQAAENGAIIWHGYTHDVTLAHDDEEGLRVAANVFTHSREAILITDSHFAIVECNAAFSRITGYERDEVAGRQPDFLGANQHNENQFEKIYAALQAQGHWQGELLSRHKNGDAYATLASINAVKDRDGQVTHHVAIFSDISGIKQTQQELMRYANYDALTGLPNRRLLQDRLSQALSHAQRTDGRLAVCMLDLDGFKPVNDTHGHDAGDRLLKIIADRLTSTLRADDTVARLGGDEFVLVLRDLATTQVFERILSLMRQPIDVGVGVDVRVTASIGVAHLRSRMIHADQLLREADQALYKAKRSGRDCFMQFEPDAELRVSPLPMPSVRQ